MLRTTIMVSMVLAATFSAVGQTWQRASTLSTNDDAGLVERNGGLLVYNNHSVQRSTDDGSTWINESERFPTGISATCVLGGSILAFYHTEEPGMVNLVQSFDGGNTWEGISNFDVPLSEHLIDVELYEGQLFAYSSGGSVQASFDGGHSWHQRRVGGSIGGMTDLAVVGSMWVACGTDGAAWSVNGGITWYPVVAPIEVGSGIFHVENYQGKIWGGGLYGSAEFDPLTRSWVARNNGIPVWAGLVAKPVAFVSRDNVLFGVFQSFDGFSTVLRWKSSVSKWVEVKSDGLPRFNKAGKHQLACSGNKLYMYVLADDINYMGVYNAVHDAPTDVDEDVVENSSVDVMPQPASESMTIRTGTFEPVNLSITDIQGRIVYSENVVAETNVDVHDVAPGMYMLRITGATVNLNRLVLVQR